MKNINLSQNKFKLYGGIREKYYFEEKEKGIVLLMVNFRCWQRYNKQIQMGNCVKSKGPRVDEKAQIGKAPLQNDVPCDICTEPLSKFPTVIFGCKHTFHTKCVGEFAKATLDQQNSTCLCASGCGRELSYDQMKKVLKQVQFVLYEKLIFQKLILQKDQYLFCPTANCPAVYEIAEDDFQYFECMYCKKEYCLICRRAKHGQKDCDFGEEELSKAAMTKAGMKECPYCHNMVDKIDGCSSVICRCGNEFCFDCGGTKCPHGTCLQKMKKQ